MATQKVTAKILEDAKKEAEEILDKYKKEAAKIKDEYDKKIGLKKTEIEADVETTKKVELLRTVSQKRLEINKSTLAQKREFIQDTIEQALKELSEHKGYLEFLKALIKKSGEKDGKLIICERDWKRYGTDLEKFMKKENLNLNVSVDNKITGGVMVKKEKITHHGSLDLIGELLRDELSIAVTRKLY